MKTAAKTPIADSASRPTTRRNMAYDSSTKHKQELLDRIAQLSPDKRAALEQRLLNTLPGPSLSDAIPSAGSEGESPLTHTQRRVWAFEQLFPDTTTYQVHWMLSLEGRLRHDALDQAIQSLLQRHSALRATFHHTSDGPVQRISAPERLIIERLAVADHAQDRMAPAKALAEDHRAPVFELSKGPLVRVALIRLREEEHWLQLVIHHLVTDGWSMSVLQSELMESYSAIVECRAPKLPASPVEYSEFASLQAKGWAGKEVGAKYWLAEVNGAPPLLELPLDSIRPDHPTPDAWNEYVPISSVLLEQLERVCREREVTLYVLLVAAWALLLQRCGCGDEIMIGSPFAARNRPGLESLVGFIANTLPLRIDLGGDPHFSELMGRVQEKVWRAFEHQDAAFDEVLETAKTTRSPGVTPVFQTVVAYLDLPAEELAMSGLRVRRNNLLPTTANFDVMFSANQFAGRIEASIALRAQLFDSSTCHRMCAQFLRLLQEVAADPVKRISRYPLTSEAERQTALALGCRASRPYPRQSVHALFAEQAALSPSRIALSDRDRKLTYEQLRQESGRIAAVLDQNGVGPGDVVAVLSDRSVAMVAAFLAVLQVGAAYLPLDTSDPEDRTALLIRESGAKLILTTAAGSAAPQFPGIQTVSTHRLPPGEAPAGAPVGPDAAAYVMFTSGSTGQPKAVVIPHRGIVRLVRNNTYARLGAGDVFLHMAPPAFDASTFEIWAPLLNGGRCVVYGGQRANFREIGDAIRLNGVTTLWLTSSLFNAVIDEAPQILAPLDQLLIGGEALSVRHVAKAVEALPGVQLINGYGPTESTTFACCYPIPRDFDRRRTSIPIGPPIANTEAYVLDHHLEPVAIGIPGQLYLGGDGLALGYLNRPDLTAGAFIPDPFQPDGSRRLYRTGDRVRWLPDGSLEYLGRMDRQVKLRGFRIELGEIEEALCRHPRVLSVAAKVVQLCPGDRRLAVWYVPNEEAPVEAELRAFAERTLPAYMLPFAYVPLPELPLTPNGKLDRDALCLSGVAEAHATERRPPVSSAERAMTRIWEDVLSRSPIGMDDDFFQMGGHSLLGARLLARVEKMFHHRLPLVNLFLAPTPGKLLHLVRKGGGALGPSYIIPLSGAGTGSPLLILGLSPVFRPFLTHVTPELPLFALGGVAADRVTVPYRLASVAAMQVAALSAWRPEGPLVLAGWCMSGVLAYEMAQQFRVAGRQLPLVVMIDSPNPQAAGHRTLAARGGRMAFHIRNLVRLDSDGMIDYGRERWQTLAQNFRSRRWRAEYRERLRGGLDVDPDSLDLEQIMRVSVLDYEPQPYPGTVLMLRPTERPKGRYADSAVGWRELVPNLQVVDIPGNHSSMFSEPNAKRMAEALQAAIEQNR